MKKKITIIVTLFLALTTTCFPQKTIEELIASKPIQLKDNFKILNIQTIKKNKIVKATKVWSRITKTENFDNVDDAYFLIVSDSNEELYLIVSQKADIIDIKKIKKGNKYEMKISMFYFCGVGDLKWLRKDLKFGDIYIPWPRNGWADRVYISPNLQGLYYVRDPVVKVEEPVKESD